MLTFASRVLNACTHLAEGRLSAIDFPLLRASLDTEQPERIPGRRATLLAFAAQCPTPGAVDALRAHDLLGHPHPGGRLMHSTLRYVHPANAGAVARVLDEDIQAMRRDPTTYAHMAHALWVWSGTDIPVRNALRALGVERVARLETLDTFPLRFPRWRITLGSPVARAAAALVAEAEAPDTTGPLPA